VTTVDHPRTPVARRRWDPTPKGGPTQDPGLCDEVLQQLFAIGLAISTTQQRCNDQPAVAARIAEHMTDLQHVIEQVRSAALVTQGRTAGTPGKLIARTGQHDWPRRSTTTRRERGMSGPGPTTTRPASSPTEPPPAPTVLTVDETHQSGRLAAYHGRLLSA